MAICNIMKELRENKKLSMSKIAEALEIPKGTYASYEYGQREPNIEMINKIANFYGVTTDYLLGREPVVKLDLVELVAKAADFNELEKSFFSLYISYDHEKRTKFLSDIFKQIEKVIKETAPEHSPESPDN